MVRIWFSRSPELYETPFRGASYGRYGVTARRQVRHDGGMAGYLIELMQEGDVASELDLRAIERLAAHALEAEGVARPAELSITFADDALVQRLNREYRDTDEPTDVLSFGQADGEEFTVPPGEARHLGDIVISVDTARRQADEHTLALDDEVAHLVVHGVLHLLGYDHELPADEAVMRRREDAILGGRAHHH